MYKPYIKRLVIATIAFIIGAIYCMYYRHVNMCAFCTVWAFIFWYAGMMAPDHEKYKDQ
jgi:hypothetical protein